MCDDAEYLGQEGVSDGIVSYYRRLYAAGGIIQDDNDDGFYENSPRLSDTSRGLVDADFTESELKDALGTCSDSAPGSDGIPYSIYKKLWEIVGPYILEAWNYSCSIGIQSESHRETIIVLLPKEGRDIKNIKNWRPITLSNCDAKIITKALAMRLSNILSEIIVNTQVAYVRGRSVTDKL